MDLRERGSHTEYRHPWELSRIAAFKGILGAERKRVRSVLDIGCGDAYTASALMEGTEVSIAAVDLAFSPDDIATLSAQYPGVTFCRDCAELGKKDFQLILLLHVLEHIEDERTFLAKIVKDYVATDGVVLVTVPGFPSIYSEHDRYLGHVRRYRRVQLREVCSSSGLSVSGAGYFFASLLMVRFLDFHIRRILGKKTKFTGVGQWNHGAFLTNSLCLALNIDQIVCRSLSRFGIHLPGLSVWALCRKPQ